MYSTTSHPLDLDERTFPAFSGTVYWNADKTFELGHWETRSSTGSAQFELKASLQKVDMVSLSASKEPGCEAVSVVFGTLFDAARHTAETVHNWIKKPSSLSSDILGEFAIAGWNEQQRTLTLMTDAAGTRPIYFIEIEGGIAFATDMKSLLRHCRVPNDFNLEEVSGFLINDQWRSHSHTIINDIKKVPPATVATFTPEKRDFHQYWSPENAPQIRYKKSEEYVEHGRELLKTCVQNRIQSFHPFDLHLSGGLDSSVIAAIVCSSVGKSKHISPVGYAWQPALNEHAEPTLDQKLFQTACEAFDIGGVNIAADVNSELEFLQFDPAKNPVSSTLALEHRIMRDASSRGSHLILSGWGGDQVFSFPGYPLTRMGLNRFLRQLPRRITEPKKVTQTYFRTGDHHTTRFNNIRSDWSRRTTRMAQINNFRMSATVERMESWSVFGAHFDIQYSYPLLDRRLIDFALGVPPELYVAGRYKRNLMRQVMEGLVPDEIRLNPDKDEPARFANSDDVRDQSLEICSKLLHRKEYNEDRAQYLDVERLKKDIELLLAGTKKPIGKINRALSFLNLRITDDHKSGC